MNLVIINELFGNDTHQRSYRNVDGLERIHRLSLFIYDPVKGRLERNGPFFDVGDVGVT